MQRLLKRLMNYSFVSSLKIPVVSIENYLKDEQNALKDCEVVANAFHEYGCLYIKDPRVDANKNNRFLDEMEKYFENRAPRLGKGQKIDVLRQYNYQVGITPEGALRVQDFSHISSQYVEGHQSATPNPVPTDSKFRYLWNAEEVTSDIPPNQVPSDFPDFENIMNDWAKNMLNGVKTVSEMAAIGLGLNKDIFTSKLKKGAHKLAPSVTDLKKARLGSIMSAIHYDFGFLTIHGKSRYPGLDVWLRNGQKCSIKVPEGHLLLQSGKQFQYLTGGHVMSGFHEVIYNKQVQKAANRSLEKGQYPWRISSTLFSNIRSDVILEPLDKFKSKETMQKYPTILASDYMTQEINANRNK